MRYVVVLLILLFLLSKFSLTQEIEVNEVGFSNEIYNGAQQDRDEAIIDAKLKAIEKAGVNIKGITTVENYQIKKDIIETNAEAILLPGFSIMDIGYGLDSLYKVVLIGKVAPPGVQLEDEGVNRLKLAKALIEDNTFKALEILSEIIELNPDSKVVEEVLYLLIVKGPPEDANERLEYLKAYYPESSYIKTSIEELEQNSDIDDTDFELIPKGSYKMGTKIKKLGGEYDEQPVRKVTISAFFMMKTEVTQRQWFHVMESNPACFKAADHPIEQVSWNQVNLFISRLNSEAGKRMYRLPTEAEWEYACRSGSETRYSFGNSSSHLFDYAWFNDNADDRTHPVGRKQPNSWGLYDMHGNVWEWCIDSYGKYSGGKCQNPKGPGSKGQGHCIRGGSWKTEAGSCRSANRAMELADTEANTLGFRLVKRIE